MARTSLFQIFVFKISVQDIFFVLSILLFYFGSILSEVIIKPAFLMNTFYYFKLFLLLSLAVIVSRQIDLTSMHSALFFACALSLIVGVSEILNPGLCEYFSYVNAVRPCSGIRVSAFYNEPSHIAFLFFTFYVYSNIFWVYKIWLFCIFCRIGCFLFHDIYYAIHIYIDL